MDRRGRGDQEARVTVGWKGKTWREGLEGRHTFYYSTRGEKEKLNMSDMSEIG